MLRRSTAAAIAWVICATLPVSAFAQTAAPTAGTATLVGYWLVTVTGEPTTRTLIVTEEAPTAGGALLSARYGLSERGQSAVEARITRSDAARQLGVTTQAASVIAAAEQADGSFKGTFTYRNGKVVAVTIARISEAEAKALQRPRPAAATAAAASAAAALPNGDWPARHVGDRWEWDVAVSSRDTCTNGIPSGAKEIETVVEVRLDGSYVSEMSGPRPETRYKRTYGRDLSYPAAVGSDRVTSSPITFPLRPGHTWNTTLAGGQVVTTLQCQHESPERLKTDAGEWEVHPITCKGTWRNTASGNSDQAVYKYWYAPVARAFVRRTVFTYFQGRVCADLTYQLVAR